MALEKQKKDSIARIAAAVICRGCTLFTILIFCLFALQNWAKAAPYLSVGSAGLLLVVSFVISASLELKRISRLPAALRIFLQYLAAVLSFHFLYANLVSSSGARMLTADAIFTLLYAAVRIAIWLIAKPFRRRAD